ncbi:bifunctional transcriptional activator/DNA repair enzyme AdaA [Tsuneonella amylolytica]|uniref:bifunctional transcriptional activator/DNA repair enzyme AdaA n=1 Tax=Tsuneonella amylolytica TaxID=2338327 RepID=UPI000EA87E46|nr:methylated-DNA--[protein]-cysteine S-methyltransferase [Tsuneonella amylolytica]
MDTATLTDDDRWRIALAKDRRFDEQFVTGVHSTGIYCRPSCAARPPLRRNVRFYASPAEAEAAGLRACLRCKPGDVARDEAAVRAAIDEIRSHDDAPSLAGLAALTGYSASHFQRIFTRITGLSPAAYARALREERARATLSGAARVSDAIYDAGYSGPGRFYEAMEGKMGMAPSAWRGGGRGETIHWAVAPTTLGPMLVAATARGVCRLSFGEGRAELEARFPHAQLVEGGAEFEALLADVVASVESPGEFSHIPLDVQGTAFQERCWQVLRAIPPGETRTYAEIAAAAGNPKAVRAAGSANARNNVAVLIPCHRVIRTGGDLGGYAYGLDIKRELLKRESGR